LLLGLSLSACGLGVGTTSPNRVPNADPSVNGIAATDIAPPQEDDYFIVDQLVRSTEVDGIDLHLRYVERVNSDLMLHVSFYNNHGEDLAYVSGIDPRDARLTGAASYPVAEVSPTLAEGIAPENGWIQSAATVGTLRFADVHGETWTLQFPGFPPLQFNLQQPLESPPQEPPLPVGEFDYDIEVTSTQLENVALRVEQIEINDDALRLTIAFVNRNNADIRFSSSLTGADGVVLDSRWQQYWPADVDPSLEHGIAPPGDVWGEDESNRGTVTFPRPLFGDVLLYQFPSFPPIRLPLAADAEAQVATEADLPPSAGPRPTPAVPTPEPLTGKALVRQQVETLLESMNDALGSGDRERYLQAWSADLRSSQSQLFDQAIALPLEDIEWAPSQDEQNGAVSNNQTQMRDYEVGLSFRVRDVDPENVFRTTLKLALERQDAAWVITELEGTLPFWAYAPTEATRSGAFWIFYHPSMASEVPVIESEAQRALATVEKVLPDRVAAANVMHVAATGQEFTELTGRSSQHFLGISLARFTFRKSGISVTNRAIFINGAAFMSDPAQDRQQTIAHELTHLVLAPVTMPYTPAWVSEGAAMYVTGDFPQAVIAQWYREQAPQSVDLATLSAHTSFGEDNMTEHQTSIDYAYSAYLTRYLAERYGKDAFFDFYESFADVPFEEIEPHLPDPADGQALDAVMRDLAQRFAHENVQAAFGIDLETLEREFEAWLGEQVS
jgi:hypothetical protein